MELTARERQILNCVVAGWDEGHARLASDIRYTELYQLLDRLGLAHPPRLTQFLETQKNWRGGSPP